MEDDLTYYDVVKKLIKDRENEISQLLMCGALKDMEHYKFLHGELSALYYIDTELRERNKSN